MPSLPTGTVTFLFTDVEGSTTLLQRLGDRRYAEVLADHQRLLRDAFAKGNGQEIDTRDLPPGVSLRDLGTHRLKDLREPEHLLQVVHPDLPAGFPPVKSLDVLPNNLPVQLTSFIGREREKAEVNRLLSSTRFLTLTGSGGAGKTRLALQVAAEVLEGFRDGVWLVELAVLSDPSLIPKAVASALSVPETARSAADRNAGGFPAGQIGARHPGQLRASRGGVRPTDHRPASGLPQPADSGDEP